MSDYMRIQRLIARHEAYRDALFRLQQAGGKIEEKIKLIEQQLSALGVKVQ